MRLLSRATYEYETVRAAQAIACVQAEYVRRTGLLAPPRSTARRARVGERGRYHIGGTSPGARWARLDGVTAAEWWRPTDFSRLATIWSYAVSTSSAKHRRSTSSCEMVPKSAIACQFTTVRQYLDPSSTIGRSRGSLPVWRSVSSSNTSSPM